MVCSRMCSTETEDTFPPRRASATQDLGRHRAASSCSGRRRSPWGRRDGTPSADVVDAQTVLGGRNAVTLPVRRRSTTSASSAVSTMRKPSEPSRPAQGVRLSGYTSLRVAIIRGPPAAPTPTNWAHPPGTCARFVNQIAGGHHSRRAIAEQPAHDKVCGRDLSGWPTWRSRPPPRAAPRDGPASRASSRVQPAQRRRTGHATQPENGQALDVGPQAQTKE